MKKDKITYFIETLCGIFGVVMGFFFLISYLLFMQSTILLIVTIVVCIIGVVYGIKLVKGFSDWKEKMWGAYSYIVFCVLIIVIIFGGYETNRLALDEWNEACTKKGLPNKCTQIDECKKDCEDLGRAYYRYEGGGFFQDSNCWCVMSGETGQIW